MFYWIRKLFLKKANNHWFADVSIAGLQHYRGNDLAEMIKEGDKLELKQQPDNQYDKNAIMVMWHNNKIGYIPRDLAKDIGRQLVEGKKIIANIVEIKPVRFGRKWIKIRLQTK